MENNKFKDTIAPTLVLVLICLVITVALVFSNTATAPQIAKIAKESADTTRAEVLTSADGFTEYTGTLNDGVTEYYIADNKSGVVVTSQAKSFGGTITVMTGIDRDGAITGVQVTNHSDTPGLGTKAMTPEYLAGYIGQTELPAAKVKDAKNVDYIVGASISSGGVCDSVKEALQQFKDLGGVQ